VLNVLLDLDGTLTDPAQGIVACIEHALASLHEPVPADTDLTKFIGPPLRDTFCELLSTTDDDKRIDKAVAAYRERFGAIGMFENVVYDGIPSALQELSARNAKLYVATSKPLVYAQRILENFGLVAYFRGVFGSELDGARSNKGELIAHILAVSGLRAEQTVMVGDRRHDIVGALKNRVFPAGVLWGYGSWRELTDAGAKKLIHQPDSLSQLVA
jgi:phosphoglycolate phosphatase